jgi:ATP-binding cassette subfamily G (WHITE) protein 2 (PDR)
MSETSIQGTQNLIFSIFLLMTIFSNLAQLITEKFVHDPALFEVRERPSKTVSWQAFLLSAIIVEIPPQSIISVLVFLCWYYPTGMITGISSGGNERRALIFLLIWIYCLFTSTFSHMTISGIEDAGTAVNFTQLLYMLSWTFRGLVTFAPRVCSHYCI